MARALTGLILVAAGAATAWGLFSHRQAGIDRARTLAEAREATTRGDARRAAALLDPHLARHPEDTEARFLRASVAQQLSDYNNARNGYLQVLAADPRHSDARARLFDLTLAVGAREEAEHHLVKLEELVGATAPAATQRRDRLTEAADRARRR